ncbi:MAG: phosphate signaling complex protein PhoU [Pseudomonadota bacterium]
METDLNITQHISQRFNEELEEVRSLVMNMGGMVEQQVNDGVQALLKADAQLGEKVASSDYVVNAMEVDIDEQCTLILARRQPAASDLRLVVSIIKTITDLERIGDEAEQLGIAAIKLADQNTKPSRYVELRHLGDHVRGMLHDALDAFARMDVNAALETIRAATVLNDECDAISRQLILQMMEDPRQIKNALQVQWCARSLERIGDHAENICEYVVYLVKGRDVRHISLDEIKSHVE